MKYLFFALFTALILSINPTVAGAACTFSGSTSSYLQTSVPGQTTFDNPLPDYEYNNRYYATPDAAEDLAECLGGTVVSIPSGFAPGSPYIKPDSLGVKLPNGQIINAGDAISVYKSFGADSGGGYYGAWEKYVNLPDTPPAGSFVTGTAPFGNPPGAREATHNTQPTNATVSNQSGASSNNAQSVYLNNLITTLNNLVQAYRNLVLANTSSNISGSNNTSAGTSSNNGTTNTASLTGSMPSKLSVSGPILLRYLRVQSTSRSWIAWREIEVYDEKGTKVAASGVTASCTWCKYPGSNSGVTPDKAIDGNFSTVWNAGETNPRCDWNSLTNRSGCGQGGQTAWIELDFSKTIKVSKIRLGTENSPDPAGANHILSYSLQGNATTNLVEFGGTVNSGIWLEVNVGN